MNTNDLVRELMRAERSVNDPMTTRQMRRAVRHMLLVLNYEIGRGTRVHLLQLGTFEARQVQVRSAGRLRTTGGEDRKPPTVQVRVSFRASAALKRRTRQKMSSTKQSPR